MKILMVTDYYLPHEGGGVEKVVYEISRRLAGLGCDIVVLTLNSRKAQEFEVREGIRIYRIPSIDLTEKTGIQLSLSLNAIFKIIRVCRIEDPDVVHTNNRFFFTTLCVAALKNLLRKPLVMTAHLGPVAFKKGWLDILIRTYETTISKWILRKSDQIIAVSKAVREHVVRLGAEASRVEVVPNGVCLEDFAVSPERKSSYSQKKAERIISVGRLMYNKGIQYLIDAAPKVLSKCPATEFIIVGDGPMKDELIDQTKRNGVAHAFHFLGFVPNVSNILHECDIFVRPSLTEGMPLAVLEAMACGLPVVASRVAGTPEIIIDHETGILVEPSVVQSLADSLVELLEDHEFALRLGNNARMFVERNHGWENTAKMTLEVYKDLCRSHKG